MDSTRALREVVVDAYDSGIDARNHLMAVVVGPPRWRWRDFSSIFAVQRKLEARAATKGSSLQAESAAFACEQFAERLEQLVRVFPDSVLATVARPSERWKDRVWSSAEEAPEVASEVRAAADVVTELMSQLHRGRVPKPREE